MGRELQIGDTVIITKNTNSRNKKGDIGKIGNGSPPFNPGCFKVNVSGRNQKYNWHDSSEVELFNKEQNQGKDSEQIIELDIKEVCKKYSNDQELGAYIRKLLRD